MPKSVNTSLLSALLDNAETLGCLVAKNQFPVLLRPLAVRRRVTSVQFRPLLVDAILTTHESGFRIFFNSNGANPVVLQEQFDAESHTKVMPSRLRFSLAHELAHTFFYDLSGGTPKLAKQMRAGGRKTQLEKLELSCNRLAAQMLLPTQLVRDALRKVKTVNPMELLMLAQRAGVSVEALVRRLADENTLLTNPYFRGCIVLVEEANGEKRIKAVAKPPHLNIARGLQLMKAGERWQLSTNDGKSLNPSDISSLQTVALTVETPQSSTFQRYNVAQMTAGGLGSTVFRLLTFEEIERR